MARRKKEPRSVHREAIAAAASRLFEKNGIAATSMDDVAKAAGYSKATLYVYYKNKEEIVSVLVMESMQKLYDSVAAALEQQKTTKERYQMICRGLVQYQQEYPLYFGMLLDHIRIPSEGLDCPPEEVEIWTVGEKINEKLAEFLQEGVRSGDLRADLPILPTILSFWGMLSGVIQLAAKKEAYLQETTGLPPEQFRKESFALLYRSIEAVR